MQHDTTRRASLGALLTAAAVALGMPVLAKAQQPPGITVGPNSVLTVGADSEITIAGGDLHVAEGATLVNEGAVTVGRDLLVDGSLRTTVGGTPAHPEHGHVYVVGEAEYRGDLGVGLSLGATFTEPQAFEIVSYETGFGELSAARLPGEAWSSQHLEQALVVRLSGAEAPPMQQAVAPAAAPKLVVYPNPITDDQLRFTGLDPARALRSVRLLDGVGRAVRDYGADGAGGRLTLPAQAAAGTYVLELRYATGQAQTAQVVVVR